MSAVIIALFLLSSVLFADSSAPRREGGAKTKMNRLGAVCHVKDTGIVSKREHAQTGAGGFRPLVPQFPVFVR